MLFFSSRACFKFSNPTLASAVSFGLRENVDRLLGLSIDSIFFSSARISLLILCTLTVTDSFLFLTGLCSSPSLFEDDGKLIFSGSIAFNFLLLLPLTSTSSIIISLVLSSLIAIVEFIYLVWCVAQLGCGPLRVGFVRVKLGANCKRSVTPPSEV